MKYLLLLIVFPFVSFSQVKVAGEMRKIMQRADLSASVELDTINPVGLYGLGVVAGLKGEIIIIDGKCYVTSVKDERLVTVNSIKTKAAMLVYQNISLWSPIRSARAIHDLNDLEAFLEEQIPKEGKSLNTPFVFLVKLAKGKINYHVIDWKDGVEHNMNNHKQFAKTGESIHPEITVLGFYSNHHQGVFTHHDSKLHLHVLTNDFKIVGHIDQIQFDQFGISVGD